MEIKYLSKNHLDQIYEISQQQFGDEGWTKSQFLSGLEDKNYINLGVFCCDELCSFATCLSTFDDINLLKIATKNNYKNKGFAKMLIQNLITFANSENKTFSLEVKSTNAVAIGLYQSQNLETVHIRKKYYQDGSDALIMFLKK